MRIVAFIAGSAPIKRIFTHIGKPAEPPRIAQHPGRLPGMTRPSRPYPTGTP
jgi:hypothetical protein